MKRKGMVVVGGNLDWFRVVGVEVGPMLRGGEVFASWLYCLNYIIFSLYWEI